MHSRPFPYQYGRLGNNNQKEPIVIRVAWNGHGRRRKKAKECDVDRNSVEGCNIILLKVAIKKNCFVSLFHPTRYQWALWTFCTVYSFPAKSKFSMFVTYFPIHPPRPSIYKTRCNVHNKQNTLWGKTRHGNKLSEMGTHRTRAAPESAAHMVRHIKKAFLLLWRRESGMLNRERGRYAKIGDLLTFFR